jgi:hypothetical protein
MTRWASLGLALGLALAPPAQADFPGVCPPNTFLAGPTAGPNPAPPICRGIQVGDIPGQSLGTIGTAVVLSASALVPASGAQLSVTGTWAAGTAPANTGVLAPYGFWGANRIFANTDLVVEKGTAAKLSSLDVYNFFGKSGGGGGESNRNAIFTWLEQDGPITESANIGIFQTSLFAGLYVKQGNPAGGINQNYYGIGTISEVTGANGPTAASGVKGIEADAVVEGGATVTNRYGVSSVSGGGFTAGTVQGSQMDAAFAAGKGGSDVPWKVIFSIDDSQGAWTLGPTGQVMSCAICGTAFNGINLTGITFSNTAFASTGFSVNGAGAVTTSQLALPAETAPPVPQGGVFIIYSSSSDAKLHVKGPAGTDTVIALP